MRSRTEMKIFLIYLVFSFILINSGIFSGNIRFNPSIGIYIIGIGYAIILILFIGSALLLISHMVISNKKIPKFIEWISYINFILMIIYFIIYNFKTIVFVLLLVINSIYFIFNVVRYIKYRRRQKFLYSSGLILVFGIPECVICSEEYVENDELKKLNCKHHYHADCIDEWRSKGKNNCPICQREVSISIQN